MAPALATAHTLSRSTSSWRVAGHVLTVRAEIPLLELARTRPSLNGLSAQAAIADPQLRRALSKSVPTALRPLDEDAACVPDRPASVRAGARGRLTVRWTLTCSRPPRPGVACDLFFDRAPNHLHVAHWAVEGGTSQAILSADRRRVDLSLVDAAPGRFGSFVVAGARHVAHGADHIAFVIALMLLGGGLGRAALIATGFTAGHSVTLALAALGWVQPRAEVVEVVVGLSVAYAALDCFAHWGTARVCALANAALHAGVAAIGTIPLSVVAGSLLFTTSHLWLARRSETPSLRLRPLLGLLFGLVHGLAFAGAFTESLQGADLVSALLGFNIGVEVAQLGIIAVTLALLIGIQRALGERAQTHAAMATAALILAAGVYWSAAYSLAAGVSSI